MPAEPAEQEPEAKDEAEGERGSGERDAEAEEKDEGSAGSSGRARWPLLVLLGALLADFYVTRRR